MTDVSIFEKSEYLESELPTLSPSRATLFKSCPLQYKFRHIDKLPEAPAIPAATGTLVHTALEELMQLPPVERTEERALAILRQLYQEPQPEWAFLGQEHYEKAMKFVENYFCLEMPERVEPRVLEWKVSVELDEQVLIRGIIDRLEIVNDEWVLSDYKTGRIPGEKWERQAFFGLRFYALICWKAFGVIPKMIRLYYLAGPETITLEPNEQMLIAFEKQLKAIKSAIDRATDRNDWRARTSGLCKSCSFVEHCPEWANTDARPA